MKTLLTAVFLFLATSQSYAHDAHPEAESKFLRVLTYEQVQSLSEKSRNQYMRALAQTLVELSEQKSKKISFFEQLFSLGSIAYAGPLYHCIGGGVPVDEKVKTCGVQSYAGFTCANAGENICNPLVFGVSSSGEPVCHKNATTKWCFDNTKLGVDQFLGPVFKANSKDDWNKLRGHLQQACNDSSSIRESRSEVASACGYVRQQMQVNEDVRKLMASGYSYKAETLEAHSGHCDDSCSASEPKIGRSSFQALKDLGNLGSNFSGFYPAQHTFARNTKEATIPGVKGELVSPMPGCTHKDHYHYRGSAFHAAQDLVAPYRTPVQSVAPGVVVTATAKGDGYGNSVVVMHKTADGEVFYSGYHHLAAIHLRKGDRVDAGKVLGTMGNTGISTGAHLHFEIMDKNQKRSNPLVYYPNGICSSESGRGSNLAAL